MISDDALNAIKLRYDRNFHSLHAEGPDAAYALLCVIGATLHQPYVERVARCIVERKAFGANDFQFRYCVPDVMDHGEPVWEGVEVEAIEEVEYLSERTFELLMLRAIRLLLSESPLEGRSGISSQTRADIEPLLRDIEERNQDPSPTMR